MSSFVSTRGASGISFIDALFGGLAPDGGLYLEAAPPSLGPPPTEATESFLASARWAARTLIPELTGDTLDAILTGALDFPIPLIEVEPDVYVLELFHGPTHAFKDIGARFMARAMLALGAPDQGHTVLAATSGDTGGAVADAFSELPGYRVAVLFPQGGISEHQRRQMTTIGGNVVALAVEGTFDDCQRLAKAAFMDASMRERFALTSANSINLGRLLPQSLYFTYVAGRLGWESSPVRFVVPCGNLGNLCAGLVAHRAGMPAEHFLAATNVNDVFVDFLETDSFEPRTSVATCSSAMDVGDPSNLERIRWLYRDQPAQLRVDVHGMAVDDVATISCITDTYARTGYVLDPHTAVAYRAHQCAPRSTPGPTVVLATAHPAKFPEVVGAAIGREVPLPDGLAAKMHAEEHMTAITPDLEALAVALRGPQAR